MRDGEGDSNFIKRLIVTCYEKRYHLGFFIMIEFWYGMKALHVCAECNSASFMKKY